jgi:hypothetical protein
MTLHTTETRTRTGQMHRTPRSQTWHSRMRVAVEEEGELLSIVHTEPSHFEYDGPRLPAEEALLLRESAFLIPDIHVSRSGEFHEVRELAQFQLLTLQHVARSISPELPPEAQQRIASGRASEAAIRETARSRWNATVGSWAGERLQLGMPVEGVGHQAIPLFPDQAVRMRVTRTARRILPCERGGAERSFVELEILSSSDEEDAARLIEEVRQGFSEKERREDALFESIALHSVLRVTTEPDGLHPHSVWTRRVTRVRFSRRGEEWYADETTEIRSRYEYP